MKRVYSWCQKDMGEKLPYDDDSVTHGICDECMLIHFPNVYEETYGDKELPDITEKPSNRFLVALRAILDYFLGTEN